MLFTIVPWRDQREGMKVHLVEQAVENFLADQLIRKPENWYFYHALVHQFNLHWTSPDPTTLKDVYDACLVSEFSQRWWKRDNYRPKEIMNLMIDADTELAALAWKDLANESASLEGRIGRFDFYCTDLLQMHRQLNIRSVETYHHQDAAMLSLYLSGMYPEKYVLYPGFDIFQSFCKAICSPDIPVVDDLGRFMKVSNIVHTYLHRNNRYEAVVAQRNSAIHKTTFIPRLLSFELILAEGDKNLKAAK